MKRFLSIIIVAFFAITMGACTPNENTASEMEQWKQECEAIPSCADWLDEEFESRLTESEYIAIIEARIDSLEGRVDKIESLLVDLMTEELVQRHSSLKSIHVERSSINDLYTVGLIVELSLESETEVYDYLYSNDLNKISNWFLNRNLNYESIGFNYTIQVGEDTYFVETFVELNNDPVVNIQKLTED